jgi:uncharacterized membrane protein
VYRKCDISYNARKHPKRDISITDYELIMSTLKMNSSLVGNVHLSINEWKITNLFGVHIHNVIFAGSGDAL